MKIWPCRIFPTKSNHNNIVTMPPFSKKIWFASLKMKTHCFTLHYTILLYQKTIQNTRIKGNLGCLSVRNKVYKWENSENTTIFLKNREIFWLNISSLLRIYILLLLTYILKCNLRLYALYCFMTIDTCFIIGDIALQYMV